jgi:hypothetical protein
MGRLSCEFLLAIWSYCLLPFFFVMVVGTVACTLVRRDNGDVGDDGGGSTANSDLPQQPGENQEAGEKGAR